MGLIGFFMLCYGVVIIWQVSYLLFILCSFKILYFQYKYIERLNFLQTLEVRL